MAKKKNKSKRKDPPVVDDQNLERFAGSSDEEHENGEEASDVDSSKSEEFDSNSDSDLHENKSPVSLSPGKKPQELEDLEDREEEEEEEVDPDVENAPSSGMANAMARILGTQVKTSSASAVLAKTVTPLQRMAKKEKERMDEAREKRQANRERKLTALHIPLSVATTRATKSDESRSIVNELELERTHRRVATRGVVALFNAITQHQKGTADNSKPSANTKSTQKQDVANMTKHGFLDMIKKSASENKVEPSSSQKDVESRNKTKPQWNALKDDYMLNSSKMKDWDKESSDDEEGSQEVNDDWSDEEKESSNLKNNAQNQKQPYSKRRKVVSQ